MRPPEFYHDYAFTFAETATIAGRDESELRTRVARGDSPVTGLRKDGRLYFSVHDAYTIALLGALTDCGVSPAIASRTAPDFAGYFDAAVPFEDTRVLVTPQTDGQIGFHIAGVDELVTARQVTVVLPLRAIWDDVVARAYAAYATEVS